MNEQTVRKTFKEKLRPTPAQERELGRELGPRAIIAHLGNGASMVALKEGLPMDTSMGLTPTDRARD